MSVQVEKGFLAKVSVCGGNFRCDVHVENGHIQGVSVSLASVFSPQGDAISLIEFAVNNTNEFERFIRAITEEIGAQIKQGKADTVDIIIG